jgi:hypothetical protein
MYEVWEIADGREKGELIVALDRDFAEMTAKLRARLRKVGAARSAEEANQFRRYLATHRDEYELLPATGVSQGVDN